MRGCKENKSLYPGTPGTILSRKEPDWFSPAGSKPRSLVLILGHNLNIYRILTAWGWCTDCSDRTRNWELVLLSFLPFLYWYPWQLYLEKIYESSQFLFYLCSRNLYSCHFLFYLCSRNLYSCQFLFYLCSRNLYTSQFLFYLCSRNLYSSQFLFYLCSRNL